MIGMNLLVQNMVRVKITLTLPELAKTAINLNCRGKTSKSIIKITRKKICLKAYLID